MQSSAAIDRASFTEGLRSSGTSPTVHLVGPGRVGRAFLRELAASPARLVAVSDSAATVFRRGGLDPLEVIAHKERHGSIAGLPGAQRVAAGLAASLVRADVVVDATPSDPARAAEALARCRAVLRSGARLVLAGKSALAIAAGELLAGDVGCHAALGGTGAQLVRELGFLRGAAREVALVANASTTALFEAFEEGLGREDALARLQERGVLEPDPTLDLDGRDAAQKLAIVARAVLGIEATLADVEREDARAVEPARAWLRARGGRTTRLVARAERADPRSGARARLRVACEELPRSSPLAVPSDRVAYAYQLGDGRWRAHFGTGIGPRGTARALLADVLAPHLTNGAAGGAS